MKLIKFILYFLPLLTVTTGCREDELVVPAEYTPLPDNTSVSSRVLGFYLVNEGNMGSNKCTVDYFDYATRLYARNIYAERNPDVIKELGDVGNDIGIYGDKLYVVVNCSHKVEVMEARSGRRIGQVDIPNCRYIRFHGGRAYVSSYVGPVQLDRDTPKGAVYEVDTASLTVTRTVTVGYQPEEMEIVDGYMYVANSGGYRAPDYDHTLSVVDMSDFRQVRQIPVGINLHRVRCDRRKQLWVTSRGDNMTVPSRLYRLKPDGGEYHSVDTLDVACSDFVIKGDSLLYFSTRRDALGVANNVTYGVIDIRTGRNISDAFITDGTQTRIEMPYSIAVHPETGDIFVTDAKNYVSSGTLYCYTSAGLLKWSVRTGDIPASMTFLTR